MTPLYRVWCKFEPNHVNLPAGRRGQWRVKTCWQWNGSDYAKHDSIISHPELGMLAIPVSHYFQPGSIVRPHKELRRVLAARKAMQ
jgi:hypothetical protein